MTSTAALPGAALPAAAAPPHRPPVAGDTAQEAGDELFGSTFRRTLDQPSEHPGPDQGRTRTRRPVAQATPQREPVGEEEAPARKPGAGTGCAEDAGPAVEEPAEAAHGATRRSDGVPGTPEWARGIPVPPGLDASQHDVPHHVGALPRGTPSEVALERSAAFPATGAAPLPADTAPTDAALSADTPPGAATVPATAAGPAAGAPASSAAPTTPGPSASPAPTTPAPTTLPPEASEPTGDAATPAPEPVPAEPTGPGAGPADAGRPVRAPGDGRPVGPDATDPVASLPAEARTPASVPAPTGPTAAADPSSGPLNRLLRMTELVEAAQAALRRSTPERVKLALSPARLGALEVEIRVEHEELHLVMRAEQAAGAQRLVEHLLELRRQLGAEGLRVADVEVSVAGQDHDTAGTGGHGGRRHDDDAGPPSATDRRPLAPSRRPPAPGTPRAGGRLTLQL